MNKCLKFIKYDIKTIPADNTSKCQVEDNLNSVIIIPILFIRSNQKFLEIFLKQLIKSTKLLRY